MVNDIIFCKSFIFNTYRFANYRSTDNRKGIDVNYFAFMVKGNAKIRTDSETVTISEGDIFFLPNGCKYTSYWYGEPQIEFISLGFGFMPNFEGRYYPPQILPRLPEAIDIMKDIAAEATPTCETVGKFYTLAGLLMKEMIYRSQSKQSELIDRARRLIAENPGYTVRELAKKCAVSESCLYTLFKNHSDKSIGEIKRSVIMEKARQLIVSTDGSIEQISRMMNFSSDAYFRKCFKEYFGTSPREMRKKYTI